MKLTKRLWLWVFEFKVRRVKDTDKVTFLAQMLLKELEGQGYTLISTDGMGCVNLNIYRTLENRFEVENTLGGWGIKCGTYQPQIEETTINEND